MTGGTLRRKIAPAAGPSTIAGTLPPTAGPGTLRPKIVGAATAAFVALLVAVVPLQAQDGGEASARFTIDDAIELVDVSEPRLSSDGRRVLFTRTTLDWEENERPSRIWIVGADGTDARPYTSGRDDHRPRWSPDGRWVAFLREVEGEDDDGEEKSQLFLIRTEGGEARQLTEHPTSVGAYEWGPHGERLYFVAEDSLSDAEAERREKGYDAVFVNEGPNGQRRDRWSNLWWVAADPDSGEAKPLTEGDRIVDDFAVSPGGGRVAFTYRTENHRNDEWRSEIALVETATGEIRTLTDNEAPESEPGWSPDGDVLTYLAPDRDRWRLDQGNLYALEPESGRVRQLIPDFSGAIRSVVWSPDGSGLVLSAQSGVDVSLYRVAMPGGEIRRLGPDRGVAADPTVSGDGRRVAFVHETPRRPGDVYLSEVDGFDPARLTRSNPEVEAKPLAAPEVVTWESRDGLRIQGLLYRPASAEGAFVLEVHGGPAGAFTREFDSDARVLAAHGYAVLQPNVRGSSGYGDGFLRGNMEDIGGGDYRDLMTGVDAMLERGVADADSLAIKGWSYGGILGGWTLTRTDRFRAASLGAMVADWPSEFGEGFHFDVVRWYLGGDPWSNAEVWRQRSAYTHMDQVTTPTLLFHGRSDRVDTMGQSMNFHQALRWFDVPTRFVLFPREGHGIEEPRHHRTRLVEELRWFQHHVRGDEEWSAPPRPAGGEPEEDEK